MELPPGDVLYRPEGPMLRVYFRLRGTVSVAAVMRDGDEVGAGVVGREGMAGRPVFVGTESATFRGRHCPRR